MYGKLDSGHRSERANGTDFPDEWGHGQLGFRADWQRGDNRYSLHGDVYRSSGEQVNQSRAHLTGANLVARWERALPDGSVLRVQGVADRTTRDMPYVLV